MTSSSGRYSPPADLRRYAVMSLVAATATIILKAGAALITGSVGLLSDAAESLVNLVAAAVALVSIKIAAAPADDDHHYGHTKVEYFSAIIEGVMIFLAAGFIIASAILRLMEPHAPEQLGWGLLISVIASVINGGTALVLLRAGRKHNSAILIADGKHLMTDVVTSAAVLLGVALVWITGIVRLDPIVALLAGVNILWTGYKLVAESVHGLMDRALPDEDRAVIDEVLERHRVRDHIDFHAIRTRSAGSRQFMGVHILVPGHWTVQHGHEVTEQIIDDLVEAMPELRVSAHLEPIEDPKSYEDMDDYR